MIFVDAHVHIYDCFHIPTFFDSALSNFNSIATKSGQRSEFTAILILTDWFNQDWFQHLASHAGSKRRMVSKTFDSWTFHRTNESCSLYMEHWSGRGFYLVAGRKIITFEDLELLAFPAEKPIKDGMPLKELIQSVKEIGAIPVIPWSPGKWMGRRGVLVKNIMEEAKKSTFLLCDSGNRPIFWPRPSHFKLAEAKGIRIISGSDPLPFPSECQRAGSFVFSVKGSITPEQPAKDIKHILLDTTSQFRIYGRLENPYRFFRNQLAMQISKRLRKVHR